MKKIHRLIIITYVGPFVATFFVAVFLLLMQFLWKYIDELVGKGLDLSVIGELMSYAAATMVPMALPLAILMSSIMTFGNLGEKYELVALKSSGISLQRIMFPLIVVTLMICYLAFLFSNNVLPVAHLKMRVLIHDIRQKRPELDIKSGIFYSGIDNFSIKVAEKNKKSNVLYNLMIYDHRMKRGNVNVTVADSGQMVVTAAQDRLIFTLWNGNSYEEVKEDAKRIEDRGLPHRKTNFEKQTITVGLEGYGLDRTNEDLFKDSYGMMNMTQLDSTIDTLNGMMLERKTSFCKTLLATNFFRKEEKKPDSLQLLEPDKKDISLNVNIDSLYLTFSSAERVKIISMATNYARSNKTYVQSTNEDVKSRDKWIRRHEIAWHKKLSLSFACLVLFFVGAPLGAIIRKGGIGMPVVVSVILFIVYYIFDITGEKFAKEGILPAYQGMWLSTAILFPLGIFLTYKASNDSAIINIDAYLNFIQKLLVFRKIADKNMYLKAQNINSSEIKDEDLADNLLSIKDKCREVKDMMNKDSKSYFKETPNVDELYNELFVLYNDTVKQLIVKHNGELFYRRKVANLPYITERSNRISKKIRIILIASSIPIVPGIIIYTSLVIRKSLFFNKLQTIESECQELSRYLKNPGFLEMHMEHENSAANK